MTRSHKLHMCDICLEGRKVFLSEQEMYSKADLERHNTGTTVRLPSPPPPSSACVLFSAPSSGSAAPAVPAADHTGESRHVRSVVRRSRRLAAVGEVPGGAFPFSRAHSPPPQELPAGGAEVVT